MKTLVNTFEIVSLALLFGCSSTPVALAPVGPNPSGFANNNYTGQLEVFSAVQECRDGNEYDPDPAWYQHTDYFIYSLQGKRIKHVFNTVGHYAETPSVVSLPAGRYLVKAEANGYPVVAVPVVIEPGRTTRVHLDNNWKPLIETSTNELVFAPGGYPVGWSVQATQTGRSN